MTIRLVIRWCVAAMPVVFMFLVGWALQLIAMALDSDRIGDIADSWCCWVEELLEWIEQ